MVRSKKINQQNSTGFVCANKKNQLGNTVEEKTYKYNTEDRILRNKLKRNMQSYIHLLNICEKTRRYLS